MEDLGYVVTQAKRAPLSDVAIIGGGYAGMAAAVRLAELGVACTVFEAAKTLGGRARRITYRDTTLDNGQHILSGAYSQLLRLMALVGVPASSYERIPLTLTMQRNNKTIFALRAPKLPAPLHLAVALLTAQGLAFSERRAAIRLMQALKSARFKVDPSLTVLQLLAQYAQPQKLIDYLWQPLTISALNTPIDAASAQVFAHVLRDALAAHRAASDLILPKVDLSQLFPEPAEEWLLARSSKVLLGAKVNRISSLNEGVEVDVNGETHTFKSVVIAIGPHQLAPLGLAQTEHFRYEPIYTVYLKYPHDIQLNPAMLGCLGGMTQWFFDRAALSTKLSSNNRQEAGLIAAVISASGAHELLDHDALAQRVHDELVALIGPLPTPLWHKVVAEKFATFACTPQLHRPATETAHPNIFLSGDYVDCDYPATLEAAVRNGLQAAEAAANYLATQTKT
jgi:hydroxysqualene dehydroxylase